MVRPNRNPIRAQTQSLAWNKYCAALSALDTTDPDAAPAAPFEHPCVVRKEGKRIIVRW